MMVATFLSNGSNSLRTTSETISLLNFQESDVMSIFNLCLNSSMIVSLGGHSENTSEYLTTQSLQPCFNNSKKWHINGAEY